MRWGPYEIVADYHTHTRFSHGRSTVLENVRAARERGLEAVAISDHGPANLFGIGVASLDSFDAIRREVIEAQEMYPDMKVLLGVEANVISVDGRLDIPLEMQERFDVVLVGLHPMVQWRPLREGIGLIARNLLGGRILDWKEEARWLNTTAIVNAVLSNRVHAVTHPGYRLSIDTEILAKACARTGCALEINSSHTHTTVEYIQIAKDAGARFVLGSDAHSAERVGDLGRAAAMARNAGLDSADILNVRADNKVFQPQT